MDKGPVARRLNDAGLTSIQFVLAAGLSLILFVGLANLVVVQYGRGAVRSALEQGARAGAVARSAEACESAAWGVVDQLLGGSMSSRLTMRCTAGGGGMSASADAVFEAWIPLTPDFVVSITTEAYLEPAR
jgi:hypothetical protein